MTAHNHKRTEITVETDRVLIIRRHRSIKAWCPECGGEVEMVGLREAEAVTGLTGRALRDCAQARGWHVSESPEGDVQICLESLLKSM
jgi:hypothetical protein